MAVCGQRAGDAGDVGRCVTAAVDAVVVGDRVVDAVVVVDSDGGGSADVAGRRRRHQRRAATGGGVREVGVVAAVLLGVGLRGGAGDRVVVDAGGSRGVVSHALIHGSFTWKY